MEEQYKSVETKKTTEKTTKANPTTKKIKAKKKAKKLRAEKAVKSFPSISFEETLIIGNAIQTYAAGQKIRRLTLFEHLGKSADSGPSRALVTSSSKYHITVGGYQADYIELTELGKKATNPEASQSEILNAKFQLSILGIEPFQALYNKIKGNKLPSQAVLEDTVRENGGIDESHITECVERFIVNIKYLGMLRQLAGSERILPIEQIIEELPNDGSQDYAQAIVTTNSGQVTSVPIVDFRKVCFYIAPIGEEDSEVRNHSDLFLNHLIEPALKDFDMQVIRADRIGKPGMISTQIIEHILKAKLVIADLSFHNPNVFYELSLRHTCRLPTVQIIREEFNIPFDLGQFRTIRVNCASIYTLVPNIDIYRAQIAEQVRTVLSNPDSVDNPIITFAPKLRVNLES